MNNKDIINIENFNLSYDGNVLYNNFNFSLTKGQIVGISGPTGCGKTSLLNKIVEDYIDKYKISYVFQDDKLIKDISSFENILLPLDNIYSKEEARKIATNSIKLFDLENRKDVKVSVLSGGEKQRVNLARAFSYPCDILLMDEPFSSQDEKHKQKLIEFSKKTIKEKEISAIIVSHNKDELSTLCDYIIELG